MMRIIIKYFVLAILISFSESLASQIIIKGKVVDSITGEPLPYCNINKLSSNQGVITNEQGYFLIELENISNQLQFSFIGYQAKTLYAKDLLHSSIIKMEKANQDIQEILVFSNENYLYDIIASCRRSIRISSHELNSKVYYVIKSKLNQLPLELVECYYNARYNANNNFNLVFKNGRIAYRDVDNYYFSLNSSELIAKYNLFEKTEHYPINPLQLNNHYLKKYYKLELIGETKELFHILFFPINEKKREYFHGDIWIDKDSFQLAGVNFEIENASVYPFVPIFDSGSISEIMLEFSYNFINYEKYYYPNHFNFEYSFNYSSIRDTSEIINSKNKERRIHSKGVLVFFDYENPFIEPFIKYNSDYDDFRKMSIIPYNQEIWNQNKPFIIETNDKELSYFVNENEKIPYENIGYGGSFLPIVISNNQDSTTTKPFFESNYLFWSKESRIVVTKSSPTNKSFNTYPDETINKSIKRELYNVGVQILLDPVITKTGIVASSYCVLDPTRTYNHLQKDNVTNIIYNIYFDLYEIERRKMQQEINNMENLTVAKLDSIYTLYTTSAEDISQTFLKEVNYGENKMKLQKWNEVIIGQLNIDNLKLFFDFK